MAGAPLRQNKFPGIYTGQLDRKHNGKPDFFCVVWLQYANGKAGWKTVGAHSKGMCPARASVLRKYCKGSST
ncbi:hypothetical protein [Oleidesulfovibrio alaskensis]|uniref:hypothetical protein n=1 Tax=Oleidesulfovibrio alaskensis TaxID=58180 RepID=UPI001A629FCD|nr:hypothetical protein [Oleidesulfovibrio alaskensis]MBL3581438.1 hypothetical protein [Oleidesulfovibrio alaskensis]